MSSEALQKQREKLGILRYRDKEYAVGLLWLTADADDEDPKAAVKRAKSMNADFYAKRDTVVNQIGFGYLEQGHRRKLPVAASTAADVLVGEWHGVFKADNGWWYVAVHSDAIAPDGDILFEEEEDAYQHFLHNSENYRWPRTFVPEHWSFDENAGELSLDKIFDEIPDVTLQSATLDAIFGGRRNKDVAIILSGILVGVAVLAGLASQILPSLLPEPKQAPQVQVAASDVIAAPPKPSLGNELDPLLQFGDFSLPTPSFVIYACLRGMEDIVLPLPQWEINTIKCDGRIVTAIWNSQGGNLDSIRPYISRFSRGVTHTYDGEKEFTATRLLPSLNEYKEQNIPMERDQAILLINNRFGGLGSLKVEYIVPNSQPSSRNVRTRSTRNVVNSILGQEDNKKPPFLKVQLVTSTPPTKSAEYFNIPGLSFNMIEYNLRNQNWVYQANIVLRTNG